MKHGERRVSQFPQKSVAWLVHPTIKILLDEWMSWEKKKGGGVLTAWQVGTKRCRHGGLDGTSTGTVSITYLLGQKAPSHRGLNLTTSKTHTQTYKNKRGEGIKTKEVGQKQSMQHFLSLWLFKMFTRSNSQWQQVCEAHKYGQTIGLKEVWMTAGRWGGLRREEGDSMWSRVRWEAEEIGCRRVWTLTLDPLQLGAAKGHG